MRSLAYTINLRPVPWNAPTQGYYYNNQFRERALFSNYLQMVHGNEPTFKNALQLDICFYMTIPKLTRDREPNEYHSKLPNLIDLTMHTVLSLEEALVIQDKKNIAVLNARKQYDKNPRIELVLTELV